MKKVWALVLSLAMILTLASFPTFAAESQKLDLAAIATITAMSDGGQPVGRMVDGDLGTTWEDQWSGDDNATTAIFQLNGLYNIDKIVVYAGGGTGAAPKDIKVEVSADGKTYTQIAYENYEETQVATEINTNYKWGGVTSTFDSLTATGVNYVRLTMTRNNYRLALREVEMYGTFKSALPSPVKIVGGSSSKALTYDTTYANAYDGNNDTMAFLEGTGWMTFELNNWYDLQTVDLSFGVSGWDHDLSPKAFTIQVSPDNTSWTTAYVYTADAGLGKKYQKLPTITLDAEKAKQVKYLRLDFTALGGGWAIGLSEISAIGTALNVASVDYTVNYVDVFGNPVAPAKTASGMSNVTVMESPLTLTGYTLLGIPGDQTITLSDTESENVITFTYIKSSADKATISTATTNCSTYDKDTLNQSYDGNENTAFSVGSIGGYNDGKGQYTLDNNNYIIWELDGEYDVNSLQFVWKSLWGTQDSAPRAYYVSVSSDGVVWDFADTYLDPDAPSMKGTRRTDGYAVNGKNIKYVRLNNIGNKNWVTSLHEVYVYGTPSAANTETRINPVSVNMNATVQGDLPAGMTNVPENLFDGDATTTYFSDRWDLGSLNEKDTSKTDLVYTFTLNNITSLNSVRFGLIATLESWGNQQSCITNFDIEVSSDGTSYTKVYSFAGDNTKRIRSTDRTAQTSMGKIVTDFTGDVSAVKYIKLTVTNGSRVNINEFYVTGEENTSGLSSKGAQMRLDNGTVTAGLRFATTIDKATYGIGESYSYADNNGVTFGMYLLPTDKLGEYSTLLEYINANTLGDAVNVVGKNVYSQDANALTYTAVLTQIPETSYNRDVVALPYVINNGTTVYGTEMTRSYYSVAKAMRTSGAELTEAQIAALDAIINAVENA